MIQAKMKHNYRQQLITLLHTKGIGLTGAELDRRVKLMNGNEMPLSKRFEWCVNNFDKCDYWFK